MGKPQVFHITPQVLSNFIVLLSCLLKRHCSKYTHTQPPLTGRTRYWIHSIKNHDLREVRWTRSRAPSLARARSELHCKLLGKLFPSHTARGNTATHKVSQKCVTSPPKQPAHKSRYRYEARVQCFRRSFTIFHAFHGVFVIVLCSHLYLACHIAFLFILTFLQGRQNMLFVIA